LNRLQDDSRSPSGLKDKEDERLEAALCPGGRLLTLNVSAVERTPVVSRILVIAQLPTYSII
jgi:hypothetical protein